MRKHYLAVVLLIILVILKSITVEAGTDAVKQVRVNGKSGILVYHYWDTNPDWHYYFDELNTSNYETDNINFSSSNSKIYIHGNLYDTPNFLASQGLNGTMYISFEKWRDVEYANGIFSVCIDISGWENQYHSLQFRANNSCNLKEIDVYVYNGKAYFGAGYGCFEKTLYDKYLKTLDLLAVLEPEAVLDNYMNSPYAEIYDAKKGMELYQKAHQITKGYNTNYKKVRVLYDWVAKNCTCSSASYTMEAMCSSIGIPAVRTQRKYTSDSWVFLYIDNKWIATNPNMATYSNNIGYFDATGASACGYENDYTYGCIVDIILQKGIVLKVPEYNCKVEVISEVGEKLQVRYLSNIKDSKKIIIPNVIVIDAIKYKVVGVAKGALQNNKKVTSVVVGKYVASIEKNAFRGCKNLKKINIKSTKLKSVGKNVIKNIDKNATINVPKKQYSKYKKLFKSSTGYKKTMKIKK